jgi:hypothetical protein
MTKLLLVFFLGAASAWAQAVAPPPVEPAQNVPPDTPMGTGPFPAIMEQDPGLPTHTEYRPADLAALGSQKLPIIAWGNGGCFNDGGGFRNFLTEIASYGFLAVAVGPIRPAGWARAIMPPMPPGAGGQPGAPPLPPAPPPGGAQPGGAQPRVLPPDASSKSSQLIDAINWAIAENSRKGSRYYGRLDTTHIAVMGQSCGGLQAIAVSADPRVTLTVIWNSGLFATPPTLPPGVPPMENITKDALNKLHAPIFYFTGDQANDIAYANGMDDFNRIDKVPAFHAYKDGLPHIATYFQPNGGEMGKIAVALLTWQFKGDSEAAKMFVGPDCTLCRDPKWHVLKKQMN